MLWILLIHGYSIQKQTKVAMIADLYIITNEDVRVANALSQYNEYVSYNVKFKENVFQEIIGVISPCLILTKNDSSNADSVKSSCTRALLWIKGDSSQCVWHQNSFKM